jgi:hypothetical protein
MYPSSGVTSSTFLDRDHSVVSVVRGGSPPSAKIGRSEELTLLDR